MKNLSPTETAVLVLLFGAILIGAISLIGAIGSKMRTNVQFRQKTAQTIVAMFVFLLGCSCILSIHVLVLVYQYGF